MALLNWKNSITLKVTKIMKYKPYLIFYCFLGPYGEEKIIGKCSVTCGKNGQQIMQKNCLNDDSYSTVPRAHPHFCGPSINETKSCTSEIDCPSIKLRKRIILQVC